MSLTALDPDHPVAFLSGVLAALSQQQTPLDVPPLLIGSAVLAILLFLSALFSGSEVALFTLSGSETEELEESGSAASVRVLKLLSTPRAILVTILILNTATNVAAAIITAYLTHQVAIFYAWSPTITILLEIVALTFILLVISEITPKLIATRKPLMFARRVSLPLALLHKLLGPVSRLLAKSMSAFHGRFERTVNRLSGEDLEAMADIGIDHGTLEKDESELIHSIVEFGERAVREIMISRMDMVALSAAATIQEATTMIRETGHSRLPLYVEHLDNILGVVYAKDLLRHVARHPSETRIDWTHLARSPIFVPLGKKLDDLLRDFQSRKTHIALVVDEYGGTAGLITLEDVLEEIVGDIRDEHDSRESDLVENVGANEYRVDAKIDLDELNDLTGIELETEAFEFETLGGLILHLADQIPSEGDHFEFDNLRMTVESIEGHRIGSVQLLVRPNARKGDNLDADPINSPRTDTDASDEGIGSRSSPPRRT